MPWCDDCSKFWNPNTLTVEGNCPTCGRSLAAPPTRTSVTEAGGDPTKIDLKELAGEQGRAPWHFKLMVGALAIYLGWRAWEGIDWLLHR